jgi:hypothetical protein
MSLWCTAIALTNNSARFSPQIFPLGFVNPGLQYIALMDGNDDGHKNLTQNQEFFLCVLHTHGKNLGVKVEWTIFFC